MLVGSARSKILHRDVVLHPVVEPDVDPLGGIEGGRPVPGRGIEDGPDVASLGMPDSLAEGGGGGG